MRKTGFLIILLNSQNKSCLYWDYAKRRLFLLSGPNEEGAGKDQGFGCLPYEDNFLCTALSGTYHQGEYPLCRVWRRLGFVRGMDLGVNIRSITFKTLDDLKQSLATIVAECAPVSLNNLARKIREAKKAANFYGYNPRQDRNNSRAIEEHQENAQRAMRVLHLPK